MWKFTFFPVDVLIHLLKMQNIKIKLDLRKEKKLINVIKMLLKILES